MNKAESQHIELKSSWRDEYLKVISAFANTEGGKLIVGIDDKGKTIGIKNTKRLLVDIPNKVINILGVIPNVKTENKNKKKSL